MTLRQAFLVWLLGPELILTMQALEGYALEVKEHSQYLERKVLSLEKQLKETTS